MLKWVLVPIQMQMATEFTKLVALSRLKNSAINLNSRILSKKDQKQCIKIKVKNERIWLFFGPWRTTIHSIRRKNTTISLKSKELIIKMTMVSEMIT